MLPALPKDQLLAQCRKMLLIRHFEERLIGLHWEERFRGHYHVYIGQEATGVPAISLLQPDDMLFSTHRNHGHILARGGDPGRLLAEILGRRDGYNRGKGGSFHTSPRELGFLQCSGVVGGILPLGTGAAYAAKSRASGQIAVCLFGDGALEEGAIPEAFNLASLWKLPVLYLCENNGKYGSGNAVGAAQSSTMAVYPLTDLPKAYKIPAVQVDGTDAGAVHDALRESIDAIRSGGGPRFIETQTVRWPGSATNWPVVEAPTAVELAWDVSGVPEGVRDWYRDSDPVLRFMRELVESGNADRGELTTLNQSVVEQIAAAVDFGFDSPYPELKEAEADVFAEPRSPVR